MYSIKVINYLGDREDMEQTNLIGPYPTSEARDADVQRLNALPKVYGNLRFVPSHLDPGDSRNTQPWGHSATAEEIANTGQLNDVMGILFGYDPDPEYAA